jgi:branched-chain amino acid transport system substrate-binding protein
MHQPATSRLVPPADLKNVCAETASSPVSASDGAEKAFLDAYRGAFNDQPDAYALAQYDAVMALGEVIQGLRQGSAGPTPAAVRKALEEGSFSGIAMRYRSDGHGNMAHQASIVCFDGNSPVPQVVKKYDFSK